MGELRAREFGALGEGIYLNAASFGILPRRTVEAVDAFTRSRQGAGGLPHREIRAALDRARAAVAWLIGADSDEIVLAPNTSYGVNLAAWCAAAGEPGAVVLSDGEFPANVYPWMELEARGFRVERIPADPLGRPDETRLRERLRGGGVRVLAISAVQFATGHRADLAALGEECRRRGVLFAVDGIQALGAVPLDVRALGIDFLASGGQKWLCAPFGSGFVYVRRELRERFRPPMVSWLSFRASADFSRLLEYDRELYDDGRRFELGTLGVQDYLGLATSVELLREVGIPRVREHLLELQRPVVEWIRSREDVVPVTPLEADRRAGILSFRPPRPSAVAEALRRDGIVFAVREGFIRLSPHLYNTPEEMERVVRILERAAR